MTQSIKKPSTSYSKQSMNISEPVGMSSNSRFISNSKSNSNILPNFEKPSKPAVIFSKFRNFLSDYEESEILNYREIYYMRLSPIINKKTAIANPTHSYFSFVQNDHISYRYQQIRVIGKGSFGLVIECYDHKNNEKVAIKLMRDKPKNHSAILFELELLKSLQQNDNHSIIKFIESFSFRGFFCIVMELLGDDMYTALQKRKFVGFRKNIVYNVCKQTSEALNDIHKSGIIHADIKPENILFFVDNYEKIKVIDFGCSCFVGKLLYSYIQSRYYRAPEVVLGLQYDTKIDIWSLGCVLCEMVTGQPIFPAEDETELIAMICEVRGNPSMDLIKNAPRSFLYFDEKGQLKVKPNSQGKTRAPSTTSIGIKLRTKDYDFIDLIEGCLRWDPKERFSAEDILNHKWMENLRNSIENNNRNNTASKEHRRDPDTARF